VGRIETGGSELAGDRMLWEDRLGRQEVLNRLLRKQKAHHGLDQGTGGSKCAGSRVMEVRS
jgi:hypothetical protein